MLDGFPVSQEFLYLFFFFFTLGKFAKLEKE
jgi:hypothetical protein